MIYKIELDYLAHNIANDFKLDEACVIGDMISLISLGEKYNQLLSLSLSSPPSLLKSE